MFRLADTLAEIDDSGIPKAIFTSINKRFEEVDFEGGHPWAALSKEAILGPVSDPKERRIRNVRQKTVKRVANLLLETNEDLLSWSQRIEWCRNAEDFLSLFEIVGIPEDQWKNSNWLQQIAKLPEDEGGIGKKLQQLAAALRKRFTTHMGFVARMEGRLPFGGFTSREHAIQILKAEIRRLRSTDGWVVKAGPNAPILKEEEEEVARKEFYERNIVVKEVADYLKDSSKQAEVPVMSPENVIDVAVQKVRAPRNIMTQVRNELHELNGTHPWKGLTQITVNLDDLSSDDRKVKRIASQRLQIGQRIGAILLEENDMAWWRRLQWCREPDDFRRLFATLNLEEKQWNNANWLQLNGHQALHKAILNQLGFSKWREFQEFMGSFNFWTPRIAACKTREDFENLFREHGIDGNEWSSTVWLQENGFGGIYHGILKDTRFADWQAFCDFMGIQRTWAEKVTACIEPKDFLSLFTDHEIEEWKLGTKIPSGLRTAILEDGRFKDWKAFLKFMEAYEENWVDKVAACIKPKHFLKLFRDNGIKGNEWHSSIWLQKNGYQPAYKAIVKDGRFDGWAAFKKFMGLNIETPMADIVAECITKKDFLNLFSEQGAKGDEWKKSRFWQEKNYPLYRAIRDDERFGSWQAFLEFMGEKVESFLSDRVRGFTSRDEFLELFEELNMLEEIWRSSGKLSKANSGLYQAIFKRFGSWGVFLACMDGKLPFEGIQNQQQARALLKQEILRMRQSGNWIRQVTESSKVSREEYDEIVRPHYYDNNVVVRAVVDYFQSKDH